jgi:arginase
VNKNLCVIKAPSNLGLHPPAPGREPGAWRAPEALVEAGLYAKLQPVAVWDLPRPIYDFEPQAGTRLRNGRAIRRFNEPLADKIEDALRLAYFPVVVGGDCSILLGILAGVRRLHGVALVHVDGHSDFRHPGNYDPSSSLGAVAGMDLALATGRGEPLLAVWDDVGTPLVADDNVIQLGERSSRNPNFAWPDVLRSAITQMDIFWILENGMTAAVRRTRQTLERMPSLPFWVHFDVDVLDQILLPAVDTPGSPGLTYSEGSELLRGLLSMPHCLGLDVTIFDPDLDPSGVFARQLVGMLADGFHAGST